MKAKELRDKSIEELKKLCGEKQASLCRARFEASARQLKNYKEIDALKKDIARINTIVGAQASDIK